MLISVNRGSSGLYSTRARASIRWVHCFDKRAPANFTEDFTWNSVVVGRRALFLDGTCAINRTHAPRTRKVPVVWYSNSPAMTQSHCFNIVCYIFVSLETLTLKLIFARYCKCIIQINLSRDLFLRINVE